LQQETERRQRRQNNIFSGLTQFSRFSEDDFNTYSSSSSLTNSPSKSPSQMWKPSFSFQFTAVSVLQRFYRRVKYFFIKPPTQTLPYYNPPKHPSSTKSANSLLTFLSRDDTNLFNHQEQQSPFGFINNITNKLSYYWHRVLSKKQAKELD